MKRQLLVIMLILMIVGITLLTSPVAFSDSPVTAVELDGYAFSSSIQEASLSVKITNGAVDSSADITFNMSAQESINGKTVLLLYALYQNHRLVGIQTKLPTIGDAGFIDNITITYSANNSVDACKAFIVDAYSYTPVAQSVAVSSGEAGFSEVFVDQVAYVLDTANATLGLTGNEPLLKLFLQDGTAKTFEAGPDSYLNSNSNAITAEGAWLIQTGDVIVYGTDADGILVEIEKKVLNQTSAAEFTVHGYFDGFAVNSEAWLVYYTDATSSDGDDYRIASVEELRGLVLSDVRYSIGSDGKIDFMMMKYTFLDEWGVITNTYEKEMINNMSYGTQMIVNGSTVDWSGRDFSGLDTRKLYRITKNIHEEITALTEVIPNIVVDESEMRGIADVFVTYGSPEKTVLIGNEPIVYIRNIENQYEVGTANDIINTTACFYDTDEDMVYETILLPGEANVQNVKLNRTKTYIALGTSETLTATIIPSDAANKNIVWTSSDETIAAVTGAGVVTGNKTGQATITVTAEDGGKTVSCTVVVAGDMAYVLQTQDATFGLTGENAKVQLLQQDGTVRVFEADRDCYLNSNSNAITAEGKWLVQTGDVIIYGTDADGILVEIEKKVLYQTSAAEFTVHGYFDGFAVNSEAWLVYYTDATSSDGDDYRIASVEELRGLVLSDVRYSIGSDGKIDFMMIKLLN